MADPQKDMADPQNFTIPIADYKKFVASLAGPLEPTAAFDPSLALEATGPGLVIDSFTVNADGEITSVDFSSGGSGFTVGTTLTFSQGDITGTYNLLAGDIIGGAVQNLSEISVLGVDEKFIAKVLAVAVSKLCAHHRPPDNVLTFGAMVATYKAIPLLVEKGTIIDMTKEVSSLIDEFRLDDSTLARSAVFNVLTEIFQGAGQAADKTAETITIDEFRLDDATAQIRMLIESYGYQTSDEVDALINAASLGGVDVTVAQIRTIIEAYGYQTAQEVITDVTAEGYQTLSDIQALGYLTGPEISALISAATSVGLGRAAIVSLVEAYGYQTAAQVQELIEAYGYINRAQAQSLANGAITSVLAAHAFLNKAGVLTAVAEAGYETEAANRAWLSHENIGLYKPVTFNFYVWTQTATALPDDLSGQTAHNLTINKDGGAWTLPAPAGSGYIFFAYPESDVPLHSFRQVGSELSLVNFEAVGKIGAFRVIRSIHEEIDRPENFGTGDMTWQLGERHDIPPFNSQHVSVQFGYGGFSVRGGGGAISSIHFDAYSTHTEENPEGHVGVGFRFTNTVLSSHNSGYVYLSIPESFPIVREVYWDNVRFSMTQVADEHDRAGENTYESTNIANGLELGATFTIVFRDN